MKQELRALLQMTIINIDAVIKDPRTPTYVIDRIAGTLKAFIDCRDYVVSNEDLISVQFPEHVLYDNVVSMSNRKRIK